MRLRTTAIALLLLAAGFAASCGSDEEKGEPIPVASAQELDKRLDEVQRRFDFGGGACADIVNDSQPGVDAIINALPPNVARDVRDALQSGFNRLFELSAEQCDEQKGQETEPDPLPTETEPDPLPTETEELPTETEEVPTETEEAPTETVPPEGGPGDGGAGGPPGQEDGG
jgi:hypothetical protein